MNSIATDKPVFLDTNLLVYAVDWRDEAKTMIAQRLLRNLAREGTPVVSTQVLMEFYSVATTKLHIDSFHVRRFVEDFSQMRVVIIDLPLIRRAMEISILNQLSWWDSLIVTAAQRSQCAILLSEDLNSGQRIDGVEIVNPFINP